MNTSLRSYTSAALLAALTGVLTQIAIPLPGLVPMNLATLAVFLSGALLGAKWGLVSQLVYLCVGFAGVPVFSGFQAGPRMLAGPTGGYLVGYLLAAFLVGFLLERKPVKWMLPLSMLIGLTACYTLGTLWYMHVMQAPLLGALLACVLPFLPGDACKIAAACFLASRFGIPRRAQEPHGAVYLSFSSRGK